MQIRKGRLSLVALEDLKTGIIQTQPTQHRSLRSDELHSGAAIGSIGLACFAFWNTLPNPAPWACPNRSYLELVHPLCAALVYSTKIPLVQAKPRAPREQSHLTLERSYCESRIRLGR